MDASIAHDTEENADWLNVTSYKKKKKEEQLTTSRQKPKFHRCVSFHISGYEGNNKLPLTRKLLTIFTSLSKERSWKYASVFRSVQYCAFK